MTDEVGAKGAQMIGEAIARSQHEDDKSRIVYRPLFNKITGKVTASILLQQILYWWRIQDRKPFYKFRSPCGHSRYKEGDSWIEELGFTVTEFDYAIQRIGTKITTGTNKAEALACSLVIYWTDGDRVTWYQVNEELVHLLIYLAYYEPDFFNAPRVTGKAKSGFPIYLGKLSLLDYIGKAGFSDYLYSETTIYHQTPQESPAGAADTPPDPPSPSLSETFEENDDSPAESLEPPARQATSWWARENKEQPNIAVPAQAGGFSSVAHFLVDQICRYNGITTGIEGLPEGRQKGWTKKLDEILEDWEGATLEQARLAWQAWTVFFSYHDKCTPHYTSFPTEFGPLLSAVKSGGITEASLKKAAEEPRGGDSGGSRHDSKIMRKPKAEDVPDEVQTMQEQALAELRRRRTVAGQ